MMNECLADEESSSHIDDKVMEFTLIQKKINATAKLYYYMESHRYVIAKGSAIKSVDGSSCPKGLIPLRNEVLKDAKKSSINGEVAELLQEVGIPFTSPSSAGSFCTGAACQGTEACVDKDGKKYPTEWWQEEK